MKNNFGDQNVVHFFYSINFPKKKISIERNMFYGICPLSHVSNASDYTYLKIMNFVSVMKSLFFTSSFL